jgi:hypothetical protein
MFAIESIQALFDGDAVEYTKHFRIRMKDRNIVKREIKQVLLSGEIIEEIPDDEPLPSVLIMGYTNEGRPLHVAVCG